MGRAPVPGPNPVFVDRVAARLRSVPAAHELSGPRPRRSLVRTPARGTAAVAAVATVAAAVIVLLSLVTPTARERVTSIGPAQRATTTVTSTTTTTVIPDQTFPTTAPPGAFPIPSTTTTIGTVTPGMTTTTTPPQQEPSQTTTTVTTSPTTTATAPTTSTTLPAPERLSLTCRPVVKDGRSGIACEWSQSSRPAFASYQLMKATESNAPRVVFSTRDRAGTRFFDADVAAGGHYSYGVRAFDAQGRVIGESPKVTIACC